MTLLDTSALLALILEEPGADEVGAVMEAGEAWVAAVSWLELHIRLEGVERNLELIALYEKAVAGTVDITHEVAKAAYALRKATRPRLPMLDSLIAAAASTHDMRLMHRDAHFAAIPEAALRQTMLPSKS